MATTNLTTKKRQELEALIYSVYDKIDPSHTNSDYYREILSKLSNEQFVEFMKRRLPFRFHTEVFKIEPKMDQIVDAFKLLKKPLNEVVNLPYEYQDENGNPAQTPGECMVIYIHIKRMKQMLSKKTNAAMKTEKRDMRTGLLLQEDKGGKGTDREFESLASYGLEYTMEEFRTIKADAMKASAEAASVIADKGSLSINDITITKQDSLARNMLNAYLIGANIHSNLVDVDYMTPYTVNARKKKVERE